jgi:DNA helicase IV
MIESTTPNENVTITENGEELTITDDFLKEILEHEETTGYLKEIIATIQKLVFSLYMHLSVLIYLVF